MMVYLRKIHFLTSRCYSIVCACIWPDRLFKRNYYFSSVTIFIKWMEKRGSKIAYIILQKKTNDVSKLLLLYEQNTHLKDLIRFCLVVLWHDYTIDDVFFCYFLIILIEGITKESLIEEGEKLIFYFIIFLSLLGFWCISVYRKTITFCRLFVRLLADFLEKPSPKDFVNFFLCNFFTQQITYLTIFFQQISFLVDFVFSKSFIQ